MCKFFEYRILDGSLKTGGGLFYGKMFFGIALFEIFFVSLQKISV